MEEEFLSILCNPYTGEKLSLENGKLVGIETGQSFEIRHGIPVMLRDKSLKGRNKWYKNFYDLTAFAYDLVVDLGDYLKINTEGLVRENYISKLEISPGDMVLETAIGTGSNLKFLPKHGKYYGVDISLQMLKRAQKKIKRSTIDALLIQSDGAILPFEENIFDVVFHMGGLQFYSDPIIGISEMARVAKPNTRIHILDEISGAHRVVSRLSSTIVSSQKNLSPVEKMIFLVPKIMKNISSKTIPNTHFYVLSFKKP